MNQCELCSKTISNSDLLDRLEELDGKMMCGLCRIKYKRNNNISLADNKTNFNNSIERITFQINEKRGQGYLGRGMVEVLSKTILSGENIISLVKGSFFDGSEAAFIATNKRLIFVWRGAFLGTKIEDFNIENITSIQYEDGLLYAKIKVMAAGNEAELGRANSRHAKEFCNKVRTLMDQPLQVAHNTQPPAPQVDIADQLTKLARLKEQGYLTQEEFDNQKRKLLR